MAKVYDRQQDKEVEVPAAEATQGIADGRYLPRGSVRVIAPGHRTGTVAAEDLPTAQAQGWKIADPEDIERARLMREETGVAGTVIGGAEAAAAGASLGLSSAALEALGVDPERMAARREGLGEAGTALEIAGGIAPMLGTGGAGALGTAGRVIGAPTRAAAALGREAGAVARGALGTGRAGRLAGGAAQGAVEGYFAGAGAKIDENVLGKREQVAEEILIDGGGLGALLGSGLGLGIPLAAEAASGLTKVPVSAARKLLGRATDAPGGEVGTAVARDAMGTAPTWRETAAEKAGAFAERAAPISGARPEVAGRAIRTAIREPQRMTDLLSRRSEIEDAAASVVRDDLGVVRSALDDARVLSQGASKYRRISRDMGKGADNVSPRYAEQLRSSIESRIDAMAAENAQNFGRAYDIGALREAKALVGRTFQQMVDNPRAVGAYEAMDRLKRDLSPLIEQTGGFGGKPRFGATTDMVATNKELRKIYGEVREHLEREDLWGPGAAIQKELNASWSRASSAMREFSDEAKGTGLSRIFNADGSVNQMQALRLVRQYNRTGGDEVVNALDDVLEAQLEHLRVVRKHYELPDEAARRISDAESAVKELRGKMQAQARDASDLADIMELRGAEGGGSVSIGLLSGAGPTLGAIGGSVVGGPVGAAAGVVAGTIMRPYTAARGLASILAMVDRVGKMRSSATSGTLSKILGGAGKKLDDAGRALGKLPKQTVRPIVYASAKERNERIDRARREAALLATNPLELERRVKAQTMVLDDIAPGVSGAAAEVAQRAAMYLAENAPRVYNPPFGKPLVDPLSASQYLRRVEAIEQPLETLARLNDGSLTTEHVEALDAVYPETMTAVRSEILDALSVANAEERAVPFDARLAVGVLLGIPTDAALVPETLAAIQAALGDQGQEEQVPPQKTVRAGGASNIDADRLMTPAQRVESGVARA